MNGCRIQLKSSGAILLGSRISCDGFACDCPVRVQTHIHSDHMLGFGTSKANQLIVMSGQTRKLLNALYNADLPHRSNIKALDGEAFRIEGESVELLPSNHMLGCVQVQVTCSDGYRVGYSSDFFWPVDNAIQVDELIVDSTYGDPKRVRQYDQSTVDARLVSIVTESLATGALTAVIGHNGRLQYALHVLGNTTKRPIICSPKAYPLVDVYKHGGYAMPDVLRSDTGDGLELLKKRLPCLAFVTLHERRHLPWVDRFSKVTLSSHMVGPKDPVMRYDNGDCCIALTDHADFQGTLDYVQATGAKTVWTDPRSGNAEALAAAISQNLALKSAVVPQVASLGWG